MQLSNFDFELPEELIAQTPAAVRTQSRLLVVDRATGSLTERRFENIVDYFTEQDCLVLNNSRVIPARLIGRLPSGGRVELLLTAKVEGDLWTTMAKPARKLQIGTQILFGEPGQLSATIRARLDRGERLVEFCYSGNFKELLEELGQTPLPPYIKRSPGQPELAKLDKERYQTVFASRDGSVAAPTAGLHFSKELLFSLEQQGVAIAKTTLHVGPGTFLPVSSEDITEHHLHKEHITLSKQAARTINTAKALGKQVTAVGTTSVRVLESTVGANGLVVPQAGFTEIYIYPGYQFQAIDRLITNFHLPKSSLFIMICTLLGVELAHKAYQHAIREGFRFYSYGDAMFII